MRVQALLDAVVTDNEVVDALASNGNARLAQREADARKEGLTMGITALCEALDIPVGSSERSQMQALDAAGVQALLTHIKTNRRWPTT